MEKETQVTYDDLPQLVKDVCEAFTGGLKDILGTKLYGIYMHGAAVFPDSGPVQDIDCHVILQSPLNEQEKVNISRLFESLSKQFPPLGGELDSFFILLSDARKTSPPNNQRKPEIDDEWWALHCTHIRAGRYLRLYGPEPTEIFPAVLWQDISAALDHEIRFIESSLRYPAYCVLNLCRIIYSFQERNVVVSKRFSGGWAKIQFPEWAPLIEAALRFYEGSATPDDETYLRDKVGSFLTFASERIRKVRHLS
jgi:hypothetical protein